MDDPWGKTLESPTRVHVIIGEGFPEALQDNVPLLPSTIVRIVLEVLTNGATEENKTKHTILEKILGKDFRVEFYCSVISKAVKGLHMQNIQQLIQNKKCGFGFCAIACCTGAWHKNSQNLYKPWKHSLY